jgi:glucose-1-phosphate cytidylyltransferase
MKIYAHYGFDDFVICLGYKGYVVKEYFINYYLYNSDITVELHNNNVDIHFSNAETFKVTLVDTGLQTNTAGRIKKIRKYVGDETFMLTYGDGVIDMDIRELVEFHKSHGKLATLTASQNPGRFGRLEISDDNDVTSFQEKPDDDLWINAGFFVLESGIFDYLEGDMEDVQWEKKPLLEIAADNQLVAKKHRGFWKSMDALRDKIELEQLWESNDAAWKVWQ